MCEHCGCQVFGPLAELHDDHERILAAVECVRTAMGGATTPATESTLASLRRLLAVHDAKEERGIYVMLAHDDREYAAMLRAGHGDIQAALSAAPSSPASQAGILAGLRLLQQHIFTEELDTYPYAYQTLSPSQWDEVTRVHTDVVNERNADPEEVPT